MAPTPAHSRLAASALAAVLIAGLFSTPAHAAPDKGTDITLPPLGTAHAAPARTRSTSSVGLADDGVAKAYQQWRKGTFKQHKGVRKGALRVQISHDKGGSAAATARKLGATNVTEVTPTVFVADVPFDKLRTLQDTSTIDTVKVPPRVNILPDDDTLAAAPPAGTDGGEILDKTNAAAWQTAGITGAEVKVGIIDYFSASVRDAAFTAGEVKSTSIAGTFCRSNGLNCDVWGADTEHGVAVAEILNDVAPDAKLYLASAETLADTRAAIDYFAANGVKIVTRSLTSSYDGPGNGTGPSAALVDYAVSKGITWFNAAGNAGRVQTTVDGAPAYVGGYWRGGWRDADGNGWLEFTGNGETPTEFMPVDCGYFNGLRWNDWGESGKSDYDLYASVFDSAGNERYIASSQSDQGAGADPVEGSEANFADQNSFSNIDCDTYPWYYVSVEQYNRGTSNADILEILVNTDLYFFATNAGAAAQPFVDSKNPGLAGVGAVDPVAGTAAAYYSSQGPTNDGRIKPDLATGSGFSSYSYRNQGDGGFHGTSASSPTAAALAALVLDATTTSTDAPTPAQLTTYLKKLAVVDRGAAGTDNVFGAGEMVLGGTAAFTGDAAISFADPKVGVAVTATLTGLSPAPVVSWQWYSNGAPIAGATGATYTPTGSLEGQALSVKAIAGTRDDLPVMVASSSKSVAEGTLVVGTPVIGGTPTIGKALVVNPGAWTAGTKFAYQWFRGGVRIDGATKSTYTLTSADFGKVLTVRVDGSQTGYAPASKTSAPKWGFARGTLSAPVPGIKGNLAVGQVATAMPWTWTRGTTLTYQWYSNGKAISGARSSTLKIGKALKDKTLSVKVTGSLTGYNTVTKSSATTKKLLVAAVPKISGTTKVGSTLKVSRGTWSSSVKFSYKWYRNGVAISKATASKYKLTKSDKGKKITVKVTGKRSGYVTVTLTSVPTAAIRG